MININKFVLIVSLLGIFSSTANCNEITLPEYIDQKQVKSVVRWHVDDADLLCIASTTTQKASTFHASISLTIYKKKMDTFVKIFDFTPATLSHLAMFPTMDSDGNLVTIWLSATGYIVYVFNYSNNTVKQVLETGSKMMPEFVTMTVGGKERSHGLMITQIEPVKDAKSGEYIIGPTTTAIYQWTGKIYKLTNDVSWASRFKYLGEGCQ